MHKDPLMESKQRIQKGPLALALLVLLGFYKGADSQVTDCEDDNDYCAAWANIGECEANPNYMLYNCRLSCGVCQLEANCRGGDGTSYRGTVSVTKTGKTCQRWDSQTPHEHQYTAADYPSGGLEQNNCRNPDGWVEVWCYTTDPDTRYEGCDIPACGADWLERSPDWPIDATQTPWPDAAGPHKVLDGNYYSHWNPGGRGPWYIIFDLVVRYTLSKFSITNCGDTTHDISAFQLQASASSDPYNWEDVVTVTDVATTSEIQEFGGFSATGRFWKLNITKTHGTWQPWLREVNFLGERAGADTCGLATFRHVPQTDCVGSEISIHYGVTLQFCADACCAASSCLSFQYNTGSNCYLKTKLCSDEEKMNAASGNMYDWSLVPTRVATEGPRNIAFGMPAAQSSTFPRFPSSAELAVDGNRDGNYDAGDPCFHTNKDTNPWWRVDLGFSRPIDQVVIFNRMDSPWNRLDGFNVYVGDNEIIQENPLCVANQPVQTKKSNYTISCYGLMGRYVGILIPRKEYLHLCEVEVYEQAKDWSRSNLALGQPAEQSSTVYGGDADRAVDGNRDGSFYGGSCTHTDDGSNNWWHVDLGVSHFVDEVVVFNRLDCCHARLDNFRVYVGDNPAVTLNSPCGTQQRVTTRQVGYPVDCRGQRGRYVGIHLPIQGSLTVCEVEVYGEIDHSSTKGTEFILAFPENLIYSSESSAIGDKATMLFITGTRSTPSSVEVAVPSTGFSSSISVTSSEVAVVELPRGGVELKGSQTGKEAVSVTADSPIMVYGMSADTWSTDAFLALPTDVLGTEYYVICSTPSGTTKVYPSEFVVAGTQDGTTVNVVPTQEVEFDGQHYPAGQTFTITLDRMESLQVQSDEDLTGSKITSSKPVAVLSGNLAAMIGQGATSKDHLVEMVPPVETWGTEFALVSMVGREAGDLFRVLASQDNTQVDLTDHQAPIILNAGEFWEFNMPSDQYKYLTASKPALVAQYSKSQNLDASGIEPFMMIVPSLSQFAARYTFVAADITSENPMTHHVNIVIKASHKYGLRMDGTPLSSDITWAGIPGTDLSAAHVPITSGAHVLNHASPLVIFGISVNGYRQESPLWSYGYPGGLNLNMSCIRTLQVAGDGVDNDCDQLFDEEIPNGIDDDGDGWTDEDVPATGCDKPMGMESGFIPDGSITASSEFDHSLRASRARLNTQNDEGGRGSWAARQRNINQWLQVDLGRVHTISGVITQGRHDAHQWVKSYKLQHSIFGNQFTTIVDPSTGSDKIFSANNDRDTEVTNLLDEPVPTRYVRFLPQTWHSYISMRVEVLGCPGESQAISGESQATDLRCPPEYKLLRSVCYKAFDEQLSFPDAEKRCVDEGALLAMPHDAETDQFLISLKNSVNPDSTFWIGLSDQSEPGLFKWNDGTRLQPSSTKWHPGEPTITWSGENCVLYLNSSSNLWIDGHCTTEVASYICEVPARCPFINVSGLLGDSTSRMGTYLLTDMVSGDRPVYKHLTNDQYIYATNDPNLPHPVGWYIGPEVGASHGCPSDYTHTQGRCLKIYREKMTYSLAVATCAADHGVVMMPTNSELNGELATVVGEEHENYWIGLTDPGDGRRWIWTDGSVLEDGGFIDWMYSWQREPSRMWGKGENYCVAMLYSNGKNWEPTSCDNRFRFICHISILFTRATSAHPAKKVMWQRRASYQITTLPQLQVDCLENHIGLTAGVALNVTASSVWPDAEFCQPHESHLNSPSSWCSDIPDNHQWLQVDLWSETYISGVVTKGRGNGAPYERVTSYKLQLSSNGTTWTTYTDEYGEEKIFTDGVSVEANVEVPQFFEKPVFARYIRFLPQTWNNHISMRADVLGLLPQETTIQRCADQATTLSCPANMSLSIVDATYGRQSVVPTCGDLTGNTDCRTPGSLSIVKELCEGKQHCSVAEFSIFGDPCVGIHKYLHTTYECVKGWSEWSVWSDCSVFCGGVGEQSRVRTCEGQCQGEDIQTRTCGDFSCAEWTEWGSWSPCSITCGAMGMIMRYRYCSGKGNCEGIPMEQESCNMGSCGDEAVGDCGFEEENLCGYTQERGDDADLVREYYDYYPYTQGYVVYPPEPDVMAQLTSPLVSYHTARCLEFEYRSTNGNNRLAQSYSVTVYIRFDGSTDRQYALWKSSSHISKSWWSKASIDISALKHFVVMFEIFGKVMLDNVKFSSSKCSGCSTRDYSFSCPVASDWALAPDEMCTPPSSYSGSCTTINVQALTALDKKNWEEMCEVRWPCADHCHACHNTQNITEPSGCLLSPNYPYNYFQETVCSWRIIIEKDKMVSLSVTSISLEEHPECIKDALTFYDGEGDNAPMLRRLCGSATPKTFYSTGNTVFVKFQSNFNQQFEGFVVTYSSGQPHRCWGRLSGVSWMDLRNATITTSDKFSLYFGEHQSEESCLEACNQVKSCWGYSLELTLNTCYGLLNTDDKRHYRFDVEQDHVISGFKQPCDVQYNRYSGKSAVFALVPVGGHDNRPDTVFLGEFQSEAACEYACSLETSCLAYTWITKSNMPHLLQKCYGRNVANPVLHQTQGKYTGIKVQQSVLTKPTDLAVQSVMPDTISISLVTQHQVRISCIPKCDDVTVEETNGVRVATFHELLQATTFTIYVRAFERFVESEAAVVTASTMFASPNITLTKSARNTVNIKWQMESFAWEETAISMEITCLRKRHGHLEDWEQCGVLLVNDTDGEVAMTGLLQGMDYTFSVERRVGDTLRGETAEVSSYSGLIAPTSLSALTIGPQTITVGWSLARDEGPVIPTVAVVCVPACVVQLLNGSTAELSGLEAGTNYFILVWAEFNDMQSDAVTLTATTLIPPPSGLQAPELSSSSVTLTWDSPAVQPDSYQITYKKIYGGVAKVDTIGASETQYELNGFTNKNQRYKFELTPVIHGREGDVLTLTVCLAESARLKDFQIEHTTTTAISVTWTSPSCIDVRSYELCAIPVDDIHKDPVCLQVDPKSSSAVIEGLVPGTLYCVNLTAQIAFVMGGTPTDIITDAILQATVPEPPSELQVINVTSRTVSLSWSYHGNKTNRLGNHGNSTNSSSVVYTVRYYKVVGLNGTEPGRLLVGWLGTANTSVVVEGLVDDTEYLLTVTTSVSGMHSGEISQLAHTAPEAGWSEWQFVSSCSQSCGGGRLVRRRLCVLQDGQHVQKCEGKNETLTDVEEEILSCNNVSCPVHGGWSSWSNFTSCSATCNGGSQTRSRDCTSPTPQHGGRPCAGQHLQTAQCNPQSCPVLVISAWMPWSSFDDCSETCGGGLQIRRRQCNGSSCVGEAEEIRACREEPCPVHGGWSSWSPYTACTAACGHGNQTRTRNCTNPGPVRGGNSCPGDHDGSGQETQIRDCFLKECPALPGPPTWSEWSPFGPCSVSCDNGTRQRHRNCSSENCEGPDTEVQQCFPYPCYATPPVDGMWSAWSEYSLCTVTCGGGAMQRTRECTAPVPVHGGRPCEGDLEGLGMEVQFLACNLAACNSSIPPPDNVGMCPTAIGTNNHAWPEAAAGTTQTVTCYRGVARRRCSEYSQWEAEDFQGCVSGIMAGFVDKLNGPLEDNLIPVQTIQEMDESLAAGEISGFGDVNAAAKVIKMLSQGDLLNVADGTLSNKDMFIRGLVGSVDSLLPDQNGDFWPTSKQKDAQNHVTSLINSLDDFGSSIVKYLSNVGEDYVTVHKGNIELDAAVIPAGQFLDSVTQPRPPTWGPAPPDKSKITIPAETFAEILTSYPEEDVSSIGVVTYKMKHFDKILESNNIQRHIYGNRTLNGPVLSTVIYPPPKEALLHPVIIKIHHTKMAKNPLCVYLDYEDPNRLFNPSGCEVRTRRRSYTICQCFHLTAFAVLTELETPEPKVTLPTTNLPWMGQVVAMATLSITLLILLWLRTHLDTSGYLLLVLTAFLLAIEVTIFVGMEKTDKWYGRYLCLGVSGLLHFLLLAVFMWMLARVLQLYRDANLAEGPAPWEKYCILGILLPLATAAAPVILNYDDYKDMSICWLPQTHFMEYAFVAPASFILMVSTIILGVVIRQDSLTVSKAKTLIPGFDITEDDIEKTVLLLPLVAGTWLVWSYGLHMNSIQMDFAYGALNILQGCYIFIFCCLRSREVRVSYYRKLGIPVEKSTWATLQASKQKQAKKPVYIP